MSWTKIEDGLYVHPKIRKAGAPALGLHLLALSYCGHHYQTEGFIPSDELAFLFGCAQLVERAGRKAVQRLVEVGLWDTEDGGYRLHDWMDYNPIGDIKEKRRQAANARWSRNANAYANASQVQSTSNAQSDAKAMPSRPVPVPVEALASSNTLAPTRARERGSARGPGSKDPLTDAGGNGQTAEAFVEVQGPNASAVNEALASIAQRSEKPAASGFVRSVLDTFTEVALRQPSRLDMDTAMEWEREYRYLNAEDARRTMRKAAGHWEHQGGDPARTLKAFTEWIQRENAGLADAGRRKAR